jgi:hypothetical protein
MPRTNIEPFAMVPRDLIGAVPPRALQVWCCLAQWMDAGEHYTKPRIATIARALGCQRRAIERALAELEKTGRLRRVSGKQTATANEYLLILTRAAEGYDEKVAHVRQNRRTPKEGSTKTFLTNPPVAPQGGAGADESLDRFAEFMRIYPRPEAEPSARREWGKLDPATQARAIQAARVLATVYKAAPDHRRRYTVRPARWLREKRYDLDPAQIELHYDVAGLLAEKRADEKRKRDQAEYLRREAEHEAQVRAEARKART